MIKIGLIGAGSMASRHAECYEAIDNVEIVAVADVRKDCADKLAEKFGCKAYYSGEDLIANVEADAVDIAIPTFIHAEHAIKAMEKGMNVFIEKPVCFNKEEGEKLLETEKKTGAKVMVGHVIRFWEEYAWLKEVVDSGKYGNIISAVFKRVSPSVTWAWENWFNDPERSGGAPLDLHVHDVDFMRYLMGEPKEFTAKATRNKETGAIEQIFVNHEYDNGAVVAIEACWDYPANFPFIMEYRVKLEKATITYDSACGKVAVYPHGGEVEYPVIAKAVEAEGENLGNLSAISPYYMELKYFADCVENNKPIGQSTLADSVKSIGLVIDEMESVGGVIKK